MITSKYISNTPHSPIVMFLDTNGDGTGDTDATGDYSGDSIRFYRAPDKDKKLLIDNIFVHYSSQGLFTQLGYANASALNIGIKLSVVIGNVDYDLLSNSPIKTNDDWLHHGYTYTLQSWAQNINSATVTTDFRRPIELNGKLGDHIYAELNDDFSVTGAGLNDQHFSIHGSFEV